MNRSLLILPILVLVLLLLGYSLRDPAPSAPSSGVSPDGTLSSHSESPLLVYCAASNRAVMEVIRADYEQEFGRSIQIQYGPSQTLLASVQVTGSGDLYLPADDSYLEMARDDGLVEETLPLARMQAVVAVPRGNPKGIHKFDDLLREDVRVVQASADSAAIGKLTCRVLTAQGLCTSLDQHTLARRPTVTEVANDVQVGAADATIVFDAVLHSYPQLEAVPLPELQAAHANVAVGVLTASQQPARALHFARYLSAPDRGGEHYAAHGFAPAGGDAWASVPELTVYAGSMLRPAIDDTLREFEQHEGVRIARVYNGCGILVAQMKAGQHPDAYFACDTEFMNEVRDLFPHPLDVSRNELVILVQKGNPQGISSLHDLTRPGIRLGIGHEKQCAMGWLTQQTLQAGGIQKEVMENVTVQTPTGDMLVNQMHTGSLDAAIVYLSNAAGSQDKFDAVRIRDISCSLATQPLAISETSPYRNILKRLASRLTSTASRERFLLEGFQWSLDTATGQATPPAEATR